METMELRNGRDMLSMQRLTFGAGGFDDYAKRDAYFALLDIYYDEFGGRSFDTARMYCDWVPGGDGVSERVLGEWIHAREAAGRLRRQEIVVTTKGGHPRHEDMHGSRLDSESLTYDLMTSLETLQLPYVDVYLLHRDCPSVPVSEIMPTLDSFVRDGKIRFLGVSNWRVERIAEANRYAIEHGLTPFSVSQISFSLARSTPQQYGDDTLVCMNDHEYAWYLSNDFPVMAFSAQAKGFFSKLIAGEAVTPKINSRFLTDENLARLERVRAVATAKGVSPAAVAMAYLMENPVRTSAIFSCRTPAQLRDTLSASQVHLGEDCVRFLDAGSPLIF